MDPIKTAIGIAISLAVGWLLKHKADWFNNKFIPVVTFVISLLTQIVSAAHGGAPVLGALTTMPLATAGFFDGAFFKTLVNALIQAWLATGIHSTGKNLSEANQPPSA